MVSISESLEEELSGTQYTSTSYYNGDPFLNTYVITQEDVVAGLKEIDTSKGSGIDFLPTCIIKDAFSSIPVFIAHLMNQLLKTGIIPESWALATITSIPKAGDSSAVGNWRPISILPIPGKVLEKICTRLLLMKIGYELYP